MTQNKPKTLGSMLSMIFGPSEERKHEYLHEKFKRVMLTYKDWGLKLIYSLRWSNLKEKWKLLWMEKLERKFWMRPAFDKRNDNPSKDYGIGSCTMHFAVVGKKGAMSCMIATDVYLPETIEEYKRVGNKGKCAPCDLRQGFGGKLEQFRAWSVDAHNKKPEGDWSTRCDCDLLKQGYCYMDGSSLRASEDKLDEKLMREGSDAVYEYLEKAYREWGWLK